ncbi:MAG: L17 family ribosomal protein [Candidatus Shapirobacteria bacterium]|jgi:large subunit ribosomal protein L17
MNHRKFGKKLGRNHNQRQALFRSQVRSFFTYGSIQTTETKAKAVSPIIEHLCHIMATEPQLIASRELYRHLQDRNDVNRVTKIFKESFTDQSSNFTRLTRIKRRIGDDALIVRLSFIKPVSFVVVPPKVEKAETKKPKAIKDKKIAKTKDTTIKLKTAKEQK